MKKPSIRSRSLDYLNSNPGEHKTSEIAEAIGASVQGTSTALSELTKDGAIKKIKNGTYSGNNAGTSTQTRPNDALKHISEVLRSADANKKTIDRLLNIYDSVLDNYETWVRDNVGSGTDFEKQLLFIENFKWLTAIGDKLMKRWSLEHVGYDTNTRQAQEDAKAKTEERQKEALKDAPLRDRVMVVGKYDPEAEKLIDCIPSSLEEMTDEEKEKITV